ncbi:MAG: hypothetical protein WC686_01965 [Candidatus Shapirobacteria bacterium]
MKPLFGFELLFGILGIWLLGFPEFIQAETFTSPNFKIDMGNLNVTSGKKTSDSYILTDTVGQLTPGFFESDGYMFKSGFQYIYETLSEFTFSINNLNIDLGNLSPGVGQTATNIISVSSPYGTGYQIYVGQNHPLSNSLGQTIPDTGCDIGSTCSEIITGTWISSSRYGFGFNAIGIDLGSSATGIGTSDYFPAITSFRQFADQGTAESPQICMSESVSAKNRRARISYKTLVSSLQPAGSYQNAITFTAVPSY